MRVNLFKETAYFFSWVFGIVGHFISIVSALTVSTICLQILSRIMNLLAFMLPLKIVLLAGTSGVPRYFRLFIDPANKMPWIYGLAVATVIAFILTIVLDNWIKSLAEKGGAEVLKTANQMMIIKNQREEVQDYYRRFNAIVANFIFVIGGFSVIGILDLRLLGFVTSLIIVS